MFWIWESLWDTMFSFQFPQFIYFYDFHSWSHKFDSLIFSSVGCSKPTPSKRGNTLLQHRGSFVRICTLPMGTLRYREIKSLVQDHTQSHRTQGRSTVSVLSLWTGCFPTMLLMLDHLQYHFIVIIFVRHSFWEIYLVLAKFQYMSFDLTTHGLIFFKISISLFLSTSPSI